MSRYNIETAKSAGFCFGVKRAVEIAEKTAENGRIDRGGKESEVELFGI